MSSLPIKINIAGRSYPLTIQLEEEERVREAARKINETLQYFQENYAVKDRQDLLAMTALQLVAELKQEDERETLQEGKSLLSGLDESLDAFIDLNQL